MEITHNQSKFERSYRIDRVIPILQTFGDQSQLLGFQWCEIPTEEHVEFTTDPDTWIRTTPIRYHDGVGYGINGCSRLVMEGSSSSTLKEDIDHTQDDTIKTLYASIEILTSFLRRHATASFSGLVLPCFILCSVYAQRLLFLQQPSTLIMLAAIFKRKYSPLTNVTYGSKSLKSSPIFSHLFGSKKLS